MFPDLLESVGKFSILNNRWFDGPADYMTDRGWSFLDYLQTGEDERLKFLFTQTNAVHYAILARLNEDYDLWVETQRYERILLN